ncbi:hypothetical protein [Bdellovibrio sp. HCB337]|uniref:hypothetical protein n=1 Tax=Bdellovibrio sp. HCB337 TaxID=3394358 RepID=UPI0039A6EEAA
MKKITIALILFAGLIDAHADTQSKYRRECALTSNEYKGNLPSNFTDVWCADDKRKDFGAMGDDVIHAMAVAAFYEKRMDRRVSAMNLLEKYECETLEQCKEFHHLLDWGIKSGHPARYNKDLAVRANALREKVTTKLTELK